MGVNGNLVLEPFSRVGVLADVPDVVVVCELLVEMLGDLLDLLIGREVHPEDPRCDLYDELLLLGFREKPGWGRKRFLARKERLLERLDAPWQVFDLIVSLRGIVFDLGCNLLKFAVEGFFEFFHENSYIWKWLL